MGRSLRILVVDDDIEHALSLGELFELEGHRPHVVHSGEAAISAYLSGHFDLAFMDVMMPGLNGVESFLEIRRLRPHAKVFMMTGYSVEELLQQALSQGAMGVLNKPMDAKTILSMVNDIGEDGVVVAPGIGPEYSKLLQGMMTDSGYSCSVVKEAKPNLQASATGELIILDLRTSLIDSVGYYTGLRKNGHMPPTIIVTAPKAGVNDGHEVLRDIAVTGILNKPFDPIDLLARLDMLAA
jgi:two-component system, NtrC family, response regulator HydG